MKAWDAVGYLASCLVITAFCMKDITRLRFAAVASNIAFLVYGLALGLVPVWSLHAILLPLNLLRLRQNLRCSSESARLKAGFPDSIWAWVRQWPRQAGGSALAGVRAVLSGRSPAPPRHRRHRSGTCHRTYSRPYPLRQHHAT